MRWVPVTASGRMDLRCGRALALSTKAEASWPPTRLVTSGAAPWKGTCTRSMPACMFRSAPWMCDEVPAP
jgi:hypothetical protein